MYFCVFNGTDSFLTITYSPFSSFAIVTFYKVSMNTELLNPERLLPGKYRVRFLQTADHNIFISPSVHYLVLGVLLFKTPYLIGTVDWLTLNSEPAEL